ncbi:MAG TPA: hypothetical protein VKV96_00985, partial [Roseiarcus sp.]|nr:hypothetical protein [Roseiarcus sp.]
PRHERAKSAVDVIVRNRKQFDVNALSLKQREFFAHHAVFAAWYAIKVVNEQNPQGAAPLADLHARRPAPRYADGAV